MAKSISASMQYHLEQETTSLTTCWKIERRDGVVLYLTDHDVDVVYDGNTYKAESGYQRTAIQTTSSMSVDNLDISGFVDSSYITKSDIRAGAYDNAVIEIFAVNWADLSMGQIKLRKGWIGEVLLTEQGEISVELRGMTQALSQYIGSVYQPECRADVGDSKCKFPIQPDLRQDSVEYSLGDFIRVPTSATTGQAQYENRIYECTTAGTTAGTQPTYSTTIGATTTDGTTVFTARDSFTRHATVDTVTDRSTFTLSATGWTETRDVDDWFNGGALQFESGNNNSRVAEVRDWVQSTRSVTVFIPMGYDVSPGDILLIYPGCNKSTSTCSGKFVISGSRDFSTGGNIKNFRGEPFVPGQDQATIYPGSV